MRKLLSLDHSLEKKQDFRVASQVGGWQRAQTHVRFGPDLALTE
jgi:hypothetical protein